MSISPAPEEGYPMPQSPLMNSFIYEGGSFKDVVNGGTDNGEPKHVLWELKNDYKYHYHYPPVFVKQAMILLGNYPSEKFEEILPSFEKWVVSFETDMLAEDESLDEMKVLKAVRSKGFLTEGVLEGFKGSFGDDFDWDVAMEELGISDSEIEQ